MDEGFCWSHGKKTGNRLYPSASLYYPACDQGEFWSTLGRRQTSILYCQPPQSEKMGEELIEQLTYQKLSQVSPTYPSKWSSKVLNKTPTYMVGNRVCCLISQCQVSFNHVILWICNKTNLQTITSDDSWIHLYIGPVCIFFLNINFSVPAH